MNTIMSNTFHQGAVSGAVAARKAEAYVNAPAGDTVINVRDVLTDGCALVADLLNGEEDAAVPPETKRRLAGQIIERMEAITQARAALGGERTYPCFTC
jgi:hypothetical protein